MAQLLNLGKLRFSYEGEYNPATEYDTNQVVKYGANLYAYTATSPATGQLPTNTAFWTPMLEGFNYLGEYNSATNYKLNDVVKYGGKLFIALFANTNKNPNDDEDPAWEILTDGLQYEGLYSSGTQYQIGDIVNYGGILYIATDDTVGNAPTNTLYWDVFLEGIKYLGEYSGSTTYRKNEVVTYDGSTWICILDTLGNAPENESAFWDVLAPGTFPSFDGNEGYFLSNNGTTVVWTADLAAASLEIEDGLYVGKEAREFEENSELTNAVAVFRYDNDSEDEEFAQISFQNADPTSSTDMIVYPNNGHDSYGWLSVGVTGSDFADPLFPLTGNNDAYIFYDAPLKSTYSITNKALQGGIATLTLDSTPESSEVYVNAIVTVSDLGIPFDGTFSISAVDLENDTFSYEVSGSNVSPEAASGTAVFNDVDADGNLVFATGDSGNENKIVFAAGGFATGNTQMEITPDVNVHVEIPTPSTSPSTGALTVVGGVGIQGDMNIQGDVNIVGQISFGGEGTVVETSNLAVSDPVVYVGANNLSDTLDLGIIAEYASLVTEKLATITNKSLTSNFAELTTSSAHGFFVGDVVVVADVDSTFNGTYVITSTPTTTTFRYVRNADDVSSTSASGSASVTRERRYGGVVRDATDGIVKIFSDTPERPTTTVDFANSSLIYAPLKAGAADFTSLTTGNITSSTGTISLGGTVNITSAANFTGANVTLGSGTWSGTPTFSGDLTFSGNPLFTGTPQFTGGIRVQELKEDVVDVAHSANAMTLDYQNGNIFFLTNTLSGNATVNITNAPTTNGRTFTINLFITQGSTGYIPSTLNINGSSATIKWADSTTPTPTSGVGKIDVFNFTVVRRSSAYVVLGNVGLNY